MIKTISCRILSSNCYDIVKTLSKEIQEYCESAYYTEVTYSRHSHPVRSHSCRNDCLYAVVVNFIWESQLNLYLIASSSHKHRSKSVMKTVVIFILCVCINTIFAASNTLEIELEKALASTAELPWDRIVIVTLLALNWLHNLMLWSRLLFKATLHSCSRRSNIWCQTHQRTAAPTVLGYFSNSNIILLQYSGQAPTPG